ncbi:MAG: hypothetical protein COB35_01450 [Gammaproteobacteria bacterium]|nr:MAG: hypothetical protein COB35_01450 [Gammaproteobacteria bacterium]
MPVFKLPKVALFIASTSFICSFFAMSQNFPAPSVNVVAAKVTSLAPMSWMSGTVVSQNDSKIAAEISGQLTNLAVLGRTVHQGDIIAEIDDKAAQIQFIIDKANVKKARAQLVFLQSELKRKQALAEQNLSAITDLDKTVSERDIAQGDLTVAKANLAKTQRQLKLTKLTAPFEGLVVERLSNLGEYVTNGTAIIRLVATHKRQASVFVPLTSYQFLLEDYNNNKLLVIKSALGNKNVAIKALIPVADKRSHLMEIRLDLAKIKWPIGLNIQVAIANGTNKKVLAVPRDALILRRTGTSIFKVTKDNKAQQINVETGIGAGQWVEVIGNVTTGDKIIVRGSERIIAGQTVQIKNNNKALISSNNFQ